MKPWTSCPPCTGNCQQGRACPAWVDTMPAEPAVDVAQRRHSEPCVHVAFDLDQLGLIAARAIWPVYLLALGGLVTWVWRAWPWL